MQGRQLWSSIEHITKNLIQLLDLLHIISSQKMRHSISARFSAFALINNCWILVRSFSSRFTSTLNLKLLKIPSFFIRLKSECSIDLLSARSKICFALWRKNRRVLQRTKKFCKKCVCSSKSKIRKHKNKRKSMIESVSF